LIASVVPLVPAWRIDRPFDYYVPDRLAGSTGAGSFVRIPFHNRKVRGVVVALRQGSGESLEEISATVFDTLALPQPMLELAEFIATRYTALRSPTLARMLPTRVRIPAVEPAKCESRPSGSLSGYEGIDVLNERLETAGTGVFCLQSGPGKDRAALIGDLAITAGRADRATLVCVPEVRFGSAILEGLAARFKETARLDSAQPDADRARAWKTMAEGNWLGAGGRATVLAPARPLGLIVIDEESHPSYKEDRAPRYDARKVAVERARLEGAVCVLMSPAPSAESIVAARRLGTSLIRPDRDTLRAGRPIVELVDVPEDRAVSHTLHERIKDSLRAKERVALLAPRRGYARTLWCASCARSLRCSLCEGAMAFDLSAGRVRCPRCGLTAAPPDRCPSCGGVEFRYVGAGSERLAEQIGRSFPRARVVRVDPDTIEAAGSSNDADIYVTTWIGTKASLRPDVKLVGVLDADALIHRSDWRASESAFHAFWEMAAWAGAADDGGRLVLQTNQAAHHAVQGIVRADVEWFVERELTLREELSYPPFKELIRVTVAGPGWAELFDKVKAAAYAHDARVLGPVQTTRTRGGREGLIKCGDATMVAADLRGILAEGGRETTLIVDTDPR
jgi:primosomal protein N'